MSTDTPPPDPNAPIPPTPPAPCFYDRLFHSPFNNEEAANLLTNNTMKDAMLMVPRLAQIRDILWPAGPDAVVTASRDELETMFTWTIGVVILTLRRQGVIDPRLTPVFDEVARILATEYGVSDPDDPKNPIDPNADHIHRIEIE